MLVAIDQELIHNATDASFGKKVELIIQPDLHGLTIELPNGTIITLDVNAGDVNIYANTSREQAESNLIHTVSLE